MNPRQRLNLRNAFLFIFFTITVQDRAPGSRALFQLGHLTCANGTVFSSLYECRTRSSSNASSAAEDSSTTVCASLCSISIRQSDKCIPCRSVPQLCRKAMNHSSGWMAPVKLADYLDTSCSIESITTSDVSTPFDDTFWGTVSESAPSGPVDTSTDLSGIGDPELDKLLASYYASQGQLPSDDSSSP